MKILKITTITISKISDLQLQLRSDWAFLHLQQFAYNPALQIHLRHKENDDMNKAVLFVSAPGTAEISLWKTPFQEIIPIPEVFGFGLPSGCCSVTEAVAESFGACCPPLDLGSESMVTSIDLELWPSSLSSPSVILVTSSYPNIKPVIENINKNRQHVIASISACAVDSVFFSIIRAMHI